MVHSIDHLKTNSIKVFSIKTSSLIFDITTEPFLRNDEAE